VTVPAWTPEIVVDADRARTLIRARFPQMRAERLERLGQGWDNAAYLVDGETVFRFPQRAVAAPLIEIEIAVLPPLATELPLAIPVPRWVGEPDDEYPWRFAGYALLPGTPLDIARPGVEARAALARPLARFLRALHATGPDRFLAAGLPPDRIGRLDPAKRAPQAHARVSSLVRAGALSAGRASALLEVFERDAPGTVTARLTVVHGDLYARHLLLDEARALTAVIDWGDVHLGDPAVDLSVAHELFTAPDLAAFLDEYGTIDAKTWRSARWRAIHHAILVADYGLVIGDDPLAQSGLDAIERILAHGHVLP
jgi:aminoglycoside phosphotransferase (APT) family kinase protein